jgi:hydrogenase maturation protease
LRKIVIGIGNLLRCDDGIGIHVVEGVREAIPYMDAVDLGTSSIDLLEIMKDYETVILVDAIITGNEPGTIYRINLSEGERPLMAPHSHGVDMLTALQLGKKLIPDEMPDEIILLAVEAEDVTTIRDTCTDKVQDSIKRVIGIIKEICGNDY